MEVVVGMLEVMVLKAVTEVLVLPTMDAEVLKVGADRVAKGN